MANLKIILISALVLVSACNPCPDCPPCQIDAKTASQKADPSTSQNLPDDSKLSDAGVTPKQIQPEPMPVTSFELHGRAGFDKVNIWEKPDMDSPRMGYMRKGQRIMVGDPQFVSESCPKGWFKLETGGFACQGRGLMVGTKPRYIHRPPPPPKVDELDPYRHGFVRRDWTPLYKRIPTVEEVWKAPEKELSPEEAAKKAAAEAAEAASPATENTGANTSATPETAVPLVEMEPVMETIAHCTPEIEEAIKKGTGDIKECKDYHKYTRRKFKAVKLLLSRGFWVSVSNRRYDEGTREFYYETIKGQFVPAKYVHLVKPPRFKGYPVQGDSPLPAVIVKSRNAAFFTQRNNKFRGIGPVERLAVYRVLEETKYNRKTYYKIEGERWLKSSQVEYFNLRQPPEGIGPDDKWIYIDLSRQTLEAYEGTTPVYVTLVSTGLPDSIETVTPIGKYKVNFKHLTDDMEGSIGDNEEVYSVSDVPWVQYFNRNVALHASFWHSKYGTPKSHGCINMSPADARFLFEWSDPPLPTQWHAIAATDDVPTTWVIIEGKTPNK